MTHTLGRPDFDVIAAWVEPGHRVLDLGCGDGTLLKYLIDSRGVRGVGVEIDDANVLAAMLTVALVATFAASALWQQWRAVEIEIAERGRVQSAWVLTGSLDWARFKDGLIAACRVYCMIGLCQARVGHGLRRHTVSLGELVHPARDQSPLGLGQPDARHPVEQVADRLERTGREHGVLESGRRFRGGRCRHQNRPKPASSIDAPLVRAP